MWLMTQPGLATAIVDFTSDLSPLIIGLLGVLGLSAGVIPIAAIREYLSQNIELTQETAAAKDHRDAA